MKQVYLSTNRTRRIVFSIVCMSLLKLFLIFPVVLRLTSPPNKITPDWEAQLECCLLIMKIVFNTELTKYSGIYQ